MMTDWQRVIDNTVKTGVANLARELRKGYPQAGFSLNYRIHYPESFAPGEDAIIPITIPSAEHGLFHIANAIVSVGMDRKIVDVGLLANQEAAPYDPGIQLKRPMSFTNTIDKMANFAQDINNVLFSNAMQGLLIPKTDSFSLGFGGVPGDRIIRANDRGRMTMMASNTRIPISEGGSKNGAVAWGQVKTTRLMAEEAKVKTITTKDEQEKFIKESLASAIKAPSWFTNLGGKQQDSMRDKIVKIYMDMCSGEKRTIPSLLFFEKMTESMMQRGQLSPYCEKNHEYVDGTTNGGCLQTSCPVYDQDCSKLSSRLSLIK